MKRGDVPDLTPFAGREAAEQSCRAKFGEIIGWIGSAADEPRPFDAVERELKPKVFELARLLLCLFAVIVEEQLFARSRAFHVEQGRHYNREPRKARLLGTFFGKIWIWRTYMHAPRRSLSRPAHGFFPLDRALELTRDGFSKYVMSLAVRISVELPYEKAAGMMIRLIGWSPSPRTIEEQVLGLGSYAHVYQAEAPAPAGDGDILVIEPDSKCIPTAKEAELRKRRRPWPQNPHPESKRHRGREKRRRHGSKTRRKAGDKSKNGKMATMVLIYTLRKTTDEFGRPKLIGPINPRIFASFAPKKYAFEIARREANKRGFGPKSGRIIQFVSDGDDDLETYRKEYFRDYPPDSIISTIDLPHVLEYVWSAGTSIFAEGSDELTGWVKTQKKRLLDGRPDLVLTELEKHLGSVPKTGPGNKGRRERLSKGIRYIRTNAHRMNYRLVLEQDLELGSGAVEGAIKHCIGQRFDHGGMRWIKERSDALLQLRCIAINGQWDDFMAWVQEKLPDESRIRRARPAPLPKVSKLELSKAA
ncbi:MAG: hypothetical protein HYV07_05170 [Deltaproteobacteria bacterium]|nr:hypothetical protein [Deltaproteobacteria bacterium]